MKDFCDEYKIPYEKIIITNHHTSHCLIILYICFEDPCFVFSYDVNGGMTHGEGHENTYGKTFMLQTIK